MINRIFILLMSFLILLPLNVKAEVKKGTWNCSCYELCDDEVSSYMRGDYNKERGGALVGNVQIMSPSKPTNEQHQTACETLGAPYKGATNRESALSCSWTIQSSDCQGEVDELIVITKKVVEKKCIQDCSEITDEYVICNGNRYVLDLKNNNSLTRKFKELDESVEELKKQMSQKSLTK